MITPYFEEKNFILYQEDAIELLNQFESNKFDLI